MVDLSLALYFHLVIHLVDNFFNYLRSSPLQSEFVVLGKAATLASCVQIQTVDSLVPCVSSPWLVCIFSQGGS